MNMIINDDHQMHQLQGSGFDTFYCLMIRRFMELHLPFCFTNITLKLKYKMKTYLLNWLVANGATSPLDHRALILIIYVILPWIASTAASNIIPGYLRATTVYEFGFSLLLCLINVCLSIPFWNWLFCSFLDVWGLFWWHRLLMLLNLTSFFLGHAILWLFNNLNSSVLRQQNHLPIVSLAC